jgi:hypothetical protein
MLEMAKLQSVMFRVLNLQFSHGGQEDAPGEASRDHQLFRQRDWLISQLMQLFLKKNSLNARAVML